MAAGDGANCISGLRESPEFFHKENTQMQQDMAQDTFAALWNDRVTATPDRQFLVFQDVNGTVTEWSYGEFDLVVANARALFARHGVGHGQAVHVVLKNSPIFVALWLACATSGSVFVPVDPGSSEQDLGRQIDRIKPTLGICSLAGQSTYEAAASARGINVVCFTETPDDVAVSGGAVLADLPDAGGESGAIRRRDRLAVMFTSGTTSQPKGVVLTQANYHTVAEQMAALAELREDHRWYVTLPLFHANAQYYCISPAILVGASIAITAAFSASRWIAEAQKLGVTHASLFAAPIRMILGRTPHDAPQLALEHVWFAQNLGGEHYTAFEKLVGVAPRQIYGMTETVTVVTANPVLAPRPDRIGSVVPGKRIRVTDPETGAECSGSPGVLEVAGIPGEDLFLEYFEDSEKTSLAFDARSDRDVWFSTGDLVEVCDDGALRFIGRTDDVIKVAGENVSLSDIEAAVAQAPGVLEAAVLSQPDPIRDVVPVAYVVPKDAGDPPSIAALDDWAVENLVPSARPHAWHLIAELPRTSVGKVKRFVMRDAPAAEHRE
jgi:crotonobetaine/carnitine-CoA ligase